MSQDEYVEHAFFQGWLDALGLALAPADLAFMVEDLRGEVSDLVSRWVGKFKQENEV